MNGKTSPMHTISIDYAIPHSAGVRADKASHHIE